MGEPAFVVSQSGLCGLVAEGAAFKKEREVLQGNGAVLVKF